MNLLFNKVNYQAQNSNMRKSGLMVSRGSALIISLLIITTLSGLTIAFSEDSNIELTLAGFSKNGHRAYQIGRSGVHLALALLDQDKDKTMDSLNEDWSLFGVESFPEQLPEGLSFSGRIVDENSKMNLNYLRRDTGEIDEKRMEQVLRLFRTLGLDEDLVNPILDWLDSDEIKRLNGAERDYYETLEYPYSCANGPFQTIGQIFLVKGVKEIQRFGNDGEKGILDFFTIYGDGKINLNTASSEVLQGLDEGIDSIIANAILEHRREEDFQTVDDLKKVLGIEEELFNRISTLITVNGSFFAIEATGKCQEAVAQIKAVAIREDNRSMLIYWQVM